MITGKEYLKKHVGETNIPEEHFENEIGEIMDWYADDYHQEQVKNLSLSGVSQQRELLLAYEQSKCPETWWMSKNQAENEVNDFIANNCG